MHTMNDYRGVREGIRGRIMMFYERNKFYT